MTHATTNAAGASRHHAGSDGSGTHASHAGTGSGYGRFFLMVGTSTALMFALMYLNTYSLEHVFWSETRFYMTFVMGAVMAVVMLAFMLGMYRNRAVNIGIFVGAAVLFAGALWLVRSQKTVEDESWMRAMIPHHSIAILTSSRANISDVRVKHLAKAIVTAQDREISEMRYMLDAIQADGKVSEWPTGETGTPAPVEGLQAAIATPVIASIRPDPMTTDEIQRGLGGAAACIFVRAVDADPVLATDRSGKGIAKVSGSLVVFSAEGDVAKGGVLSAEGGRMTVTPGGSDGEGAKLLFELTTEPALAVGFMGYWTCNG